MTKNKQVLGFLIAVEQKDYKETEFLLVNRGGLLDGLRCEVDPSIPSSLAMTRHAYTELGISSLMWQCFAAIDSPEGKVLCYKVRLPAGAGITSDNLLLGWYKIPEVFIHKHAGGLPWLLPLALDPHHATAEVWGQKSFELPPKSRSISIGGNVTNSILSTGKD